jgi:hypothetical protein
MKEKNQTEDTCKEEKRLVQYAADLHVEPSYGHTKRCQGIVYRPLHSRFEGLPENAGAQPSEFLYGRP